MTLPIPTPADIALRWQLIDRLGACTTLAEVDDTVRAIKGTVRDLDTRWPLGATLVRNMAVYQRIAIERGWVEVAA